MKLKKHILNLSLALLVVLASTVIVYFTHRPLFGNLDPLITRKLSSLLHTLPYTSKIFPLFAGTYIFFLLSGLAIGESLGRGRYIRAILIAAAFISLHFVVGWLKSLTAVPRPASSFTGYSFPSGHAAEAFLVAGLGWKDAFIKLVVWMLAFVIALSRIYLSAHYLSDVIVGGVLGWFWAGLFLPPISGLR